MFTPFSSLTLTESPSASLFVSFLQVTAVLLATLGFATTRKRPADSDDDDDTGQLPFQAVRNALHRVLRPPLIAQCMDLLAGSDSTARSAVTACFARILEASTSDATRYVGCIYVSE